MIVVSHITRRYRRGSETVTALDDVSVSIEPGALTVAAGPSGSGKTTLLSVIAGYEQPDAGTVTCWDRPTADLPWSALGFVPQALTLLEELSVAENVDLPGRLNRRVQGIPTAELLAALEIDHLADRYPNQISGGEQQRTAIGRALRLGPALMLADEPTGHQDRVRVKLVLDILRQHARSGNVVLISSHDEAVISAADRVITLADGRIVADQPAMR